MYIYYIKTPKYIIETGRDVFFVIKSTATINTFLFISIFYLLDIEFVHMRFVWDITLKQQEVSTRN